MSLPKFLHNKKLVFELKMRGKLKEAAELSFWINEIENYKRWYKGQTLTHYNVPTPRPEERVSGYSLEENAIRTWASVHKDKYLKHLMVQSDIFSGKTLLDIGCGPIPYALGFIDCHIFGVDPLITAYRKIGYPLDSYSNRIRYVEGNAERIPFEDKSFDAIISVNALDHVDDFSMAAREILRVLKPDGNLLVELHYHKPRVTEPLFLSDDVVLDHFGAINIEKTHERSLTELYPSVSEEEEKIVIWSNL